MKFWHWADYKKFRYRISRCFYRFHTISALQKTKITFHKFSLNSPSYKTHYYKVFLRENNCYYRQRETCLLVSFSIRYRHVTFYKFLQTQNQELHIASSEMYNTRYCVIKQRKNKERNRKQQIERNCNRRKRDQEDGTKTQSLKNEWVFSLEIENKISDLTLCCTQRVAQYLLDREV